MGVYQMVMFEHMMRLYGIMSGEAILANPSLFSNERLILIITISHHIHTISHIS
jgi:hypothetical protein